MSETRLLDDLLDPFALCLDPATAQRVVASRISPTVQQTVDALAERANEGTLTKEERAEYEALTNAADFIGILRLKARRGLDANARR